MSRAIRDQILRQLAIRRPILYACRNVVMIWVTILLRHKCQSSRFDMLNLIHWLFSLPRLPFERGIG
jgi:hypothetical protein